MPNINFNSCPNAEFEFATPMTVGVPIAAVNISAVNAPGTVTMSIRGVSFESAGFATDHCGPGAPIAPCPPTDPCCSPQTLFGITIAVSGGTATISGTPTESGKTIVFTLRATAEGVNCDRTYRIPLVRRGVDLALVLDRSGSMGWGYGGNTSPPPGQRRWDGLLTGLGVLQAHLGGGSIEVLSTDMLALRMFAGSVITPVAPFNGGLVSLETQVNQITVALNGVTPSGSTALGGGVVVARDILLAGSPNNGKAMILFSDGVQNAGDKVRVTVPNQYTHTDGNQKLSGPSSEIAIHTICLGSSGHNPPLMQGIAANNGGQSLITTTGAEASFVEFFTDHLISILSGNSPQYVDKVHDVFPGSIESVNPPFEYTFPVNRGVGSVNVTLLAPSRFEPHFTTLELDGTSLLDFAQQTSGSGFVSVAVRFPMDAMPGTTLDGEWRVGIALGAQTRAPTPFTLMVVADDHTVRPTYSLGASAFRVGDTLMPSLRLHQGGRSIEDAEVGVIVLKPGDDLNDLLARATVDFTIDPNDPNSPDTAKLAALMEDPEFLETIRARDQLLNLPYDAGRGEYRASFDGLDVTGVYQVVFRVTADDPVVGRIQRYHQQSAYVRFGDVDMAGSQLSASAGPEGTTLIDCRPVATNGKFIGPGWGPAIAIDAPGASVSNVIDRGDGRYTIVVAGPLDGRGTLSISGEPIFEGDLRELRCFGPDLGLLERLRCWILRLGLPGWFVWLILIVPLLLLLLLILWLLRR
jgi:hypothetical protein